MTPDELRARLRRKALRAARTVTLSLALGGCYVAHEVTPPPPPPISDAGPLADAGPLTDAGRDAGTDAGRDAGPLADAGGCVPDPDCNGDRGIDPDGTCDWDQFNDCCEERGWMLEVCQLPGGPLAPPEMPAALA